MRKNLQQKDLHRAGKHAILNKVLRRNRERIRILHLSAGCVLHRPFVSASHHYYLYPYDAHQKWTTWSVLIEKDGSHLAHTCWVVIKGGQNLRTLARILFRLYSGTTAQLAEQAAQSRVPRCPLCPLCHPYYRPPVSPTRLNLYVQKESRLISNMNVTKAFVTSFGGIVLGYIKDQQFKKEAPNS